MPADDMAAVVAELRRLMEQATPGPLEVRRALRPVDGEYDYAISAPILGRLWCIVEAFGIAAEHIKLPAADNAALIAAAVNALPGLLAERGLLMEVLEAAKERHAGEKGNRLADALRALTLPPKEETP